MTSISTTYMPSVQPSSVQGGGASAPARPAAPAPSQSQSAAQSAPSPSSQAKQGPSSGRVAAFVLAQTSAARQAVVQHAAKAAEPSQFKQNIEEMRARVEQAIERLNEQATQNQRSLGFEIDQATDIVIVKVRNKETGEVVRQIAAEAFVRLAANSTGDKGGLFDEQF